MTELPADELREIVTHPDKWAEYVRTIKGKPFSLSNRPYLRDIYRHFRMGETNKMVILKCARKVEKTETIMNIILYATMNIPYFTTLYTTPRGEQCSRFVNERLDGALLSSVGGMLKDRSRKTASTHKTFDIGLPEPNHLYAYSGWGEAASLLGIAADLCCIDEYQDMPKGSFESIMEVISRSEYRWMLISGTAREQGSEFHRVWEKSTKSEWDSEKGEWIHTNPSSDIFGYHLSQLDHPDIDPVDLARRKLLYTPRKFQNEVLGEFFAGGMKPLDYDVVMAARKPESRFIQAPIDDGDLYMGIDWGERTTVAILKDIDYDNENRVELVWAGKVDSKGIDENDEVSQIKELIERFNVKSVVADLGFGRRQLKELQNEYEDMVKSCYYAKRPVNPIAYKVRDKNRNLIYQITVDRTTAMEEVIDMFYKRTMVLPWKMPDWVVNELTALTSTLEQDEAQSKPTFSGTATRYGRDDDDHLFHAILYARLGMRYAGSREPMFRQFGAN